MSIYLYIKTHQKTGLKYFGKTTNDPYKYKGSGKYWLRHLKKHGNHVDTEVLGCYGENEVANVALTFSHDNDIVDSDEWANLKEENGLDGGSMSKDHTEEARKKMSENRKGKVGRPAGWKHTKETLELMSIRAKERCARLGPPVGAFKKGHKMKLPPRSEEHCKALSESLKNQPKQTCEYCGRITNRGNYTKWHGDNCKKRGNINVK